MLKIKKVAQNDFLKKCKKKFGNSLTYEILEYLFIKKEVGLEFLSMKFRMSKSLMYSFMRRLEGECFVERIVCPNSNVFFRVIK